jgi:transposase
MHRYELEDRHWELIRNLFAQTSRGRPWRDHRTVVNGILWILFSGVPWRDLPERYGPWQTAHRRFTRWRRDGTWERLLHRLQLRADKKGLLDYSQWNIDATSVRASKAAGGAQKRGPIRMSPPTTPWASPVVAKAAKSI